MSCRRRVAPRATECRGLREHLQEFVDSYRGDRVESERFGSFAYDEMIARDKVNLDITWLRDESLEDLDNLPAPEIIAPDGSRLTRSWASESPWTLVTTREPK